MSGRVTLLPAQEADAPVLKPMLDSYLEDLVAYGATPGPYDFLNEYWTEPDRSAWFIGDAPPEGFALINRYSTLDLPTDHAVAEYYIRPEARRRGLGTAAALALIANNPGQWEVTVLRQNTPALAFWQAVFQEAPIEGFKQLGTQDFIVHRFVSGGATG